MAIANKMIPKTFLRVVATCGLILSDIQSIDLRIAKMISPLMAIPARILIVSNSAFRDIIVVSVPAPANNGKAIGTILPDDCSPGSSLKNLMPKIISNPIKNITKEPARANEEISIPNKPKIETPKNRKEIIINRANPVTTEGLKSTPSFLIVMRIGILPSISITENRMTETESIAVILLCSFLN